MMVVLRARVKEKCGVVGTAEDTLIDHLIADLTPVVSYALRPEALADPAVGVQSTLNLGATEIVAGEFLAQRIRAPGALDGWRLGGIEVRPFAGRDVRDPFGLIAQGWARLRPYLRENVASPGGGILVGAGPTQEETA